MKWKNESLQIDKNIDTATEQSNSLQARIQKKLDEELPQEWMGGMKLGPKVSGNQGLSKS